MKTKKSILSTISNILFVATIMFCVTFVWTNYYTRKMSLSVISSSIITLSFLCICIPLSILKTKKLKVKNVNLQNLEDFKTTLRFQKSSQIIDYLEIIMGYKTISKIDSYHYIADNSKDVFICFQDNFNIYKIYSERQFDCIDIFCIENIAIPIQIKDLTYNLYNAEFLFNLDNSKILSPVVTAKKAKFSLKDIFCIILDKKKSKNYFWLAIILLFSSLFTPFSNYYIISSSILFILSLLARFSKLFIKDA